MFKSTKGSITMMAYAAVLFFSIYLAIIFGNSIRKLNIQRTAMDMIKSVYSVTSNSNELLKIYGDNGGELLNLE